MAVKKKESTIRCVAVLSIIALICALLLSVLNSVLYVPPSIADLSDNVTMTDLGYEGTPSGEWSLDELDDAFVKGTGGKVTMAGKLNLTDAEFYGLLVKTNSSGKLGECVFAFYFNVKTNELVHCSLVSDGATSGYTFDYAYQKLGDKLKTYDKYYVEITSDTVFDDGYTVPKGGATLTATATDNAFKLAANYYYNVIRGDAV